MRFFLVFVLLSSACRLAAANRELSQLERRFGRIGGTVHAVIDGGEPVLVVALQGGAAVNYEVLLDPGPYTLLLHQGRYRIFAFEDLNQDFVFSPGEPSGELTEVDVPPGGHVVGLDVQLSGKPVTTTVSIDLSDAGNNPKLDSYRASLGEVVSLDDKRFSSKSGVHGMWRPLSALNRNRVGMFFLEAFDPCRTPVLFVHGMKGSPQDLRPIMNALDRSRFQVWFFAYPSGLRLRFLGRLLAESVRDLTVRHRAARLFVVAHSMGGLVARSFINQHEVEAQTLVRVFVTASTPWNGHLGAEVGVRLSPVVAPAWIDLVPNSQFIQNLHERPLPSHVEHHILFGFAGSVGQANDGVVSVASMLDARAQSGAASVRGYDEDHAGLLAAEAPMSRILELLDLSDAALGPICKN